MERDSKGLGIVIKTDYAKTSDSIISVLTPDKGVLKVYCYGSRKSLKSANAYMYTEANFSLYRKSENAIYSLKDLDVISTHDYIFESLQSIVLCSLLSEVIIKGSDPDARCYELFVDSIDGLEFYNPDLVGSVFILKYLKWAGLSGDWKICPSCMKAYTNCEILGFSSIDRVAVCSDCDTMNMSYILPVNARLFSARVLELNDKDALKLRISDEQIHRIFRYLLKTLSFVFPTPLKTMESGLFS